MPGALYTEATFFPFLSHRVFDVIEDLSEDDALIAIQLFNPVHRL